MEESILKLEGDSASLTDDLHLIGHSDILIAFACEPLRLSAIDVYNMLFCRRWEVRIKYLLLHASFIITTALSCVVIGVSLCINLAFIQRSCQMLILRTTHSLSSLFIFLNVNLEDFFMLVQRARGLFIS